MAKILTLITLVAFCFNPFMVTPACANNPSDCSFDNLNEKIDIVAVNAILISKSSSVIKIFVTISNSCDKMIKIKGRLKVTINPDNESADQYPCFALIAQELDKDEIDMLNTHLVLGETNDFNVNLSACKESDAGANCVRPCETLCQIKIPYKGYRVVSKLVNYLGFPGAKKKMHLQGELKILAIGKQKMSRLKHQVDFKIIPHIKSEVLIRGKF